MDSAGSCDIPRVSASSAVIVKNFLGFNSVPGLKMADDDVATKAPESDAHEPSMISSEDTPAQQGASMGVHTFSL